MVGSPCEYEILTTGCRNAALKRGFQISRGLRLESLVGSKKGFGGGRARGRGARGKVVQNVCLFLKNTCWQKCRCIQKLRVREEVVRPCPSCGGRGRDPFQPACQLLRPERRHIRGSAGLKGGSRWVRRGTRLAGCLPEGVREVHAMGLWGKPSNTPLSEVVGRLAPEPACVGAAQAARDAP